MITLFHNYVLQAWTKYISITFFPQLWKFFAKDFLCVPRKIEEYVTSSSNIFQRFGIQTPTYLNINLYFTSNGYSSLSDSFVKALLFKDVGLVPSSVRFTCDLTFFSPFCLLLNKSSLFYYKTLIDITSIEFYSKKNFKTQTYLNYHFLSVLKNKRLTLKISLPNHVNVITSLSTLYLNACWYEREVWDLFGIFFIKNNDLRRILTDYGFYGFPLRKGFPLPGYVEIRYSDDFLQINYDPTEFSQTFRYFDFSSSWDRI